MMSKTLILAPVMAVALTACNKNEDAAAPAGDGARRTGAGQLGRRHDAVVLIPGPAGRHAVGMPAGGHANGLR